MIISVIGEGTATPENRALAERVGSELALRGAVVVCGGLGGVMEAVCKGAKSAGGVTIGILPGNEPDAANPWVDHPICTGMGYARNVIVVKSGRAVIAIGGAYGTLSELGHALGDSIPVVGLRTWGLSRKGASDTSIQVVNDPVEAVDLALQLAEKRRQPSA